MSRAEFGNFAGGVHEGSASNTCHPEKFTIAANTLFRPSGDYSNRIRTQYPSACFGQEQQNVRAQMVGFKTSPGWNFGAPGTRLYRCLSLRRHANDGGGVPQWGLDEWHHDHQESGTGPTVFNLQARPASGRVYWVFYIRGGASSTNFIQRIYGQPGVEAGAVAWQGGITGEVIAGEWWHFVLCWDMLASTAANGRFRAYACKHGDTLVNVVPTQQIANLYTAMTGGYPILGMYFDASIKVACEYEWMSGAWFDNEAEMKTWFEAKVDYDIFDDGGAPPPPPPDPNSFSITVPIAVGVGSDDAVISYEGGSFPGSTVAVEDNQTEILVQQTLEAAAGTITIENQETWFHDFSTNPTHAFDTSGANYLVVFVAKRFGGTNPTGVNFNGDALTLAKQQDDGGNRVRAEAWVLANPDAGLFNVQVTGSSQQRYVVSAYALSGVHASTPYRTPAGTSGNSTTPATTITSATTDLCLDMAAYVADTDSTLTPNAGQTLQDAVERASSGGNAVEAGSSIESGASSVAMGWTIGTSNFWAHVVMSMQPASGGGSTTYKRRRGFLRFDVASDLPADADTITSAILRVQTVTPDEDADGRNLAIDWVNDPFLFGLVAADDPSTDPTGTAFLGDLSPFTAGDTEITLLQPDQNIPRDGYAALRLGITGGQPLGKNSFRFAALEHASLDPPELIVEGTLTGTGQPPPATIPSPPYAQWFGYYDATATLSPHGSTSNTIRAFEVTASEPAVVSSLASWIEPQPNVAGTELIRMAIWADSAGAPGNLLGYTQEIQVPNTGVPGWYELPLVGSPITLAAGDYWLGDIRGGVPNIAFVRRLDTGGTFYYRQNVAYGVPPSTFGTPTGSTAFKMLMAVPYTDPIPGDPPVNVFVPLISGSPIVGATLVVTTGQWSGTAPITYEYQWLSCDPPLGNICGDVGDDTNTYVIQSSDLGKVIRCQIHATNALGDEFAVTVPTSVVTGGTPPDPPDPPDPPPDPIPGSDTPSVIFEIAWDSTYTPSYAEVLKATSEAYFRLQSASSPVSGTIFNEIVTGTGTVVGNGIGDIVATGVGTGPVVDGWAFEFPGDNNLADESIAIVFSSGMLIQQTNTACIECWINPDASTNYTPTWRHVVWRTSNLYILYHPVDHALKVLNAPDGVEMIVRLPFSLENTWIHVVLVHTGFEMILYLNGFEQSRVPSEIGPLWTSQDGGIGGAPGSSLAFPGLISEVSFHREPLAPEDVQLHYALADTPPVNTWTWTDLSSRVVEFESERGRQDILEQVEAGILTITLLNEDNALDPENVDSPYYPDIKPGKWARLRAGWDGVGYWVFKGFIEGFPVDWSQRTHLMTLRVLDRLAAFQQAEVYVAQAPIEYSGQRVNRLLDHLAVDRNSRFIERGESKIVELLSGDTFADKINALSYMQQVANESELGLLFIAADGRVVFQGRHNRYIGGQTISHAVFTNDLTLAGGEFLLADAEVAFSNEKITNIVSISGSAGGGTNVQLTRSDGASVRDYGQRSRSVSTLLNSEADQLAYATWVISRRKDVHMDIRSLLISGQTDPENLWPILLGLEISNKISVRGLATGRFPGEIDQDLHIEGIHHTFSREEGWTTQYMTSAADTQPVWILGQSALDLTARLVF